MLITPLQAPYSYKTFFSTIDVCIDATVITANRRLANHLRQQYDLLQQNNGKQTWKSLDVLPFDSWVRRCWDSQWHDARLVLPQLQEQILWQTIIQDSLQSHGHSTLQIYAVTQSAREAWQLLQQYSLSLTELKTTNSEDAILFHCWAKQFYAYCKQQNYLDHFTLIDAVMLQIQQDFIQLPSQLFFIGFDKFSLQFNKLIKIMKVKSKVEFIQFRHINETLARTTFANHEVEIETMARWAKKILVKHPDAKIGCVIPDLANLRSEIDRIFTEVFTPAALLPGLKYSFKNFNISAPQQLFKFPLTQAAVLILKIGKEMLINEAKGHEPRLEIELLDALVSSPFIAGAEQEMLSRSQLLTKLTSLGEKQIGITALLTHTLQANCLILHEKLRNYYNYISQLPPTGTPYYWIVCFIQLLQIIGWPGEAMLNSDEYQVQQRWKAMLEELQSLSLVTPSTSYEAFLKQTIETSQNTPFQPNTPTAAIQIVGALESTGLLFEHLWVMGLDDESWPTAPALNPFIPIELQKKYHMPHATAQGELKFYAAITERLCISAPHVMLSYSQQKEDNLVRPSPLITSIPEIASAELTLPPYTRLADWVYQTKQLENLIDDKGPPVCDHEVIKGGTSIFKQQAACPFRGFAEFRLGAHPPITMQAGLNAAERGSLLHDVLAELWTSLRSQQTLCSLSEQELQRQINKAITVVLSQWRKRKPSTLQQGFYKIEQKRLKKIVFNWLKNEKSRKPFQVCAVEASQETLFANLEIRLRIDRIDQLEDGTQVIIDYKTGKSSVKDWLSERPEEPQLPFYCIIHEKPISGLVFAQIRVDGMKFTGIMQNPESIPNTYAPQDIAYEDWCGFNWQTLLLKWKQVLERLGQEFRAGHAEVDPKDSNKTCRYCHLHTLCRILETRD